MELQATPARGIRVEIRNLERTFQKGGQTIRVLRGADLVLARGEAVALVGQSGSGKSTFLHLLGGLERPSAGAIEVDGRALGLMSPAELDHFRRRRVGFIFQFHHLLPDHDALHNVAMPAIIDRRPLEAARAAGVEALRRVGLEHRMGHKPGELSGGEQQRVAIARALLLSPDLILADEPTGNLDPATASEIFEILWDLVRERGATMVLVTHSMELAARFGRRLRLADGRFEEAA
jgi:lipoprotein-releasing system ATP-binding protein